MIEPAYSIGDALDEKLDREAFYRLLIDTSFSKEARLSDNELLAFLMALHGHNAVKIARVLVTEDGSRPLSRQRGQQVLRSALKKILITSGFPEKAHHISLYGVFTK